jgi:hypothetical protein
MAPVPDALLSGADWRLVCTDGRTLLCHSLFLKNVSKVYADLIDSVGKAKEGVIVDVPFAQGST